MHRPLSIRLLLIFALLFSQLGGVAHGIEHTLAERSQDQSLPHDRLCDLCASYAQLGSALGSSSSINLAGSEDLEALHLNGSSFCTTTAFVAAARAPPCSV